MQNSKTGSHESYLLCENDDRKSTMWILSFPLSKVKSTNGFSHFLWELQELAKNAEFTDLRNITGSYYTLVVYAVVLGIGQIFIASHWFCKTD